MLNDPIQQTVHLRFRNPRKLSEMTNYQEISKQIIKPNAPILQKHIKITNNNKNYYFPCIDDLVMPNNWNTLLHTRKQDDDCESDDEVIHNAINYGVSNLLEGLSKENGTQVHKLRDIL